jgi:cytochrome c556
VRGRIGEPALHAVHSEQLRETMRQLDRLAVDRLPEELDTRGARARRLAEIAGVAESMATAAAHIPAALPDLHLAHSDAREFLRLADALGEQAHALRRAAVAGDVPAVNAQLESVVRTCNACHGLFRAPPS